MKRRTLVSRKEAAEHLGLSVSWLETLHRQGGGPPFFKPTNRVALYDLAEVEQWLESTRVVPGRASSNDADASAKKEKPKRA